MLPTEYQSYIHLSRYSRWRDDLNRRENWEETVDRYINFFRNHGPTKSLPDSDFTSIRNSIINLEVMPSMRCLMTAGRALELDNVAGYNCAYAAIDEVITFDEAMYILMCGTGFGFSVERQFTNELPIVASGNSYYRRYYSLNHFPGCSRDELSRYDRESNTIVVADSKIGWASALRILIIELYNGNFSIKWDVSSVRVAGERLKTFGGRASGPEPLVDLFHFAVEKFVHAKGRRLSSLEVHDIMCKIADVVVVGGVRRSALISLSNLTDDRMRHAKDNLYYQDEDGNWKSREPQRALANNSVCYTEKPDLETYMSEITSLYASKSGERGLFNRVASRKCAERSGRREINHEFGTNPCSEIVLRSKQFCNLTEIIVRSTDTKEDLKRKAEIATKMGTMQASLVNFRYLSPKWKENTESEALLGVSQTGIMDHPILGDYKHPEIKDILNELREHSIRINKDTAAKVGINQSAAITCVKPSGTVSQLVDSASGIHPRWNDYYIRRTRADIKDPLTQLMLDSKVPYTQVNNSTVAFEFPMKAPDGAINRKHLTALEQLELWKVYQDNWCEHKPSITVYYTDDEFLDVAAWIYKHFDDVSGISLLPKDDNVYPASPYEDISKDTYEKLLSEYPTVQWSNLTLYEKEDMTVSNKELACSAGVCEL